MFIGYSATYSLLFWITNLQKKKPQFNYTLQNNFKKAPYNKNAYLKR